jgi:hypothetical protein
MTATLNHDEELPDKAWETSYFVYGPGGWTESLTPATIDTLVNLGIIEYITTNEFPDTKWRALVYHSVGLNPKA